MVLPRDFDLNYYRSINTDLVNFSDQDLINHWFSSGKFENRRYKDPNGIPVDFNPEGYKKCNKDIEHLSDEKCKDHYLKIGKFSEKIKIQRVKIKDLNKKF